MMTECCVCGGSLVEGCTCSDQGSTVGTVRPTFRERLPREIALAGLHARAMELIGPDVRTIADLGCGQGHLTMHLRGTYEVAPFDINTDQYKLRWPHVRRLDLNRDHIPARELDCILCLEVIEHLENPYKLVRDCHAALRDGGELIISTPNLHSLKSRLLYLFTGRFNAFQDMDLYRSGHINPIQFWELQHILDICGFDIDTVDCRMYRQLVIVVKATKRSG